jgi:hypothetical protein
MYCDLVFGICLDPKDWLTIWVSVVALVISFCSLVFTVRYASKSFRPIVTAMVRTHAGGTEAITYSLEILNSGSIPARDIKLRAVAGDIENALAKNRDEAMRKKWTACFSEECVIPMLHNGNKVSCSFGLTKANDAGFWKYGATIPITIEYRSWFGKQYTERQSLYIRDSDSFTGYVWSSQA